jgi:hypothetical protein
LRRFPLLATATLATLGIGTFAAITIAGGGSSASTPAAALRHSVFLSSLADARAHSTSSGFVGDLVEDYEQDYGAVGVNQLPIWDVAANQAPVTVTVRSGCNNFTANTGTRIPIPAAATTTSSDSPLVIYQPSTHTDWELWQAKPAANGTWSACWGGKLSTATSTGVFPYPYGLAASGISYLATTITEADVASGAIRHALAVDLPHCSAPQVAPADRTDCSSDPGQPPEGTWYRLPASLTMPTGLTPFAQQVFKALQTYGMVVMDQAGAVMVQAESASDWGAQGHSGLDPITASWGGQAEYAALNGMPWNHLEVIAP